MSTFLVVSGVITTAVVLVVMIAISDSDQPATIRSRNRRAKTAPRPQLAPAAAPAFVPAPVPIPTRPVPAVRTRPPSLLRRLRSTLALVLMVGILGTMVAVVIGAAVVLMGEALRNAFG